MTAREADVLAMTVIKPPTTENELVAAKETKPISKRDAGGGQQVFGTTTSRISDVGR
jgi:hypothetical protein